MHFLESSSRNFRRETPLGMTGTSIPTQAECDLLPACTGSPMMAPERVGDGFKTEWVYLLGIPKSREVLWVGEGFPVEHLTAGVLLVCLDVWRWRRM